MLPIDWFEQYWEWISEAEHLILTTLNFELTVEHPYDSLTSFLGKLGLSQTLMVNLALNLVNEGDNHYELEGSCASSTGLPHPKKKLKLKLKLTLKFKLKLKKIMMMRRRRRRSRSWTRTKTRSKVNFQAKKVLMISLFFCLRKNELLL